jgi:hypothetical protein
VPSLVLLESTTLIVLQNKEWITVMAAEIMVEIWEEISKLVVGVQNDTYDFYLIFCMHGFRIGVAFATTSEVVEQLALRTFPCLRITLRRQVKLTLISSSPNA